MSDRQQPDEDARLERLKAVVAAYGADRSKWPDDDRAVFSDADLKDDALASILSDATALDAVLAHASASEPEPGATSRIAARIAAGTNVARFDNRRTAADPGKSHTPPSYWPAAGLLAASLLVGIFLGQSDIWPDTIGGSFRIADAAVDDLSEMFIGLPLDPASLSEETL